MDWAFSLLLDRLLSERGMSPHAFATAAGLPPTSIYKILDGHRPPPAKHVRAMAQVLRLSPRDRYHFFLLAGAAHMPPIIKDLLNDARQTEATSAEVLNDLTKALAQWNPGKPFRRRDRRKRES
jgi:predicted transcriptional regulator